MCTRIHKKLAFYTEFDLHSKLFYEPIDFFNSNQSICYVLDLCHQCSCCDFGKWPFEKKGMSEKERVRERKQENFDVAATMPDTIFYIRLFRLLLSISKMSFKQISHSMITDDSFLPLSLVSLFRFFYLEMCVCVCATGST